MNESDSDILRKRIKVRYSEDEVFNLRITQQITLDSLIKDVCSKINKTTLDGSIVKQSELILSYKDGNEELEVTDVNILFENDVSILYVKKIKKSKGNNDFSDYKDRDYFMEILYNYDPQESNSNLILWSKSAKEMIKDHLYQCVFESSNNEDNVKYIINLFCLLYKNFKLEKTHLSILKTISQINIGQIIFSKYILKVCDNYCNKMNREKRNRKETKEDFLLVQSLCFLSEYQKTIDDKWEIKTIKSIVEKLKPIERCLPMKSREYYNIIKKYFNLYDSDSMLVESLPIIPTYEEIHSNEGMIFSMLRDNKLSGYKSVREYLTTHYLLLRADVLLPLQQAVNVASNNENSGKRDELCYSYKNVICKSFDFDLKNGMLYNIEFDKPYPKLKWKSSYLLLLLLYENRNRLQFGALLCLTPDNYKTLIWCTLADRKSLEEDDDDYYLRSQITVKILTSCGDSVGRLEFGLNYQMAESPEIFFEAYKYTLMSLRSKIRSPYYELPFKTNLVNGSKNVSNPSYINHFTEYEMRSLFPEYPYLRILDKWPSYEESKSLDESQLAALKNMLTKEISLVQGPPGTGKTYVGSLAVKILLENHQYNGPILVVCYTNHALDQFLETFTNVLDPGELVRIGGGCKSEELEKYSLKLLTEMHRRGMRMRGKYLEIDYDDIEERMMIREELKELKEKMNGLKPTMDMYKALSNKPIVSDLDELNSISLNEQRELKRLETLEPLPYLPYSILKENIGKENLINIDSIIEEEEDPSHIYAFDPIFKWINQTKYDQLKSNGDYYGKQSLFREWFNRIHCSEEDKEKEIDYYSIYENNIYGYVMRYRESFDEYMNMKMSEGLWSLNQLERESLYNKWKVNHYQRVYRKYQMYFQMYKSLSSQYERLNVYEEVEVLKDAKMIGMTTTGAARLIDMIDKLGIEVMVIEEAGEVLEAHTLALFCESLKHLILIGDHKQLRPSVVNFNLENKYHLTRSLFERLVLNGVDKVTLNTQRRMRPEISDLIRCNSLYPNLLDHESTKTRRNIRGVVYNVYFFDHKEKEPLNEGKEEESRSKVNKYECQMIIHFVKYLVQVGYKPEKITILSFYLGQCQLIYEECKNMFGKEIAMQFRIISVDNFQGEENDIIIFSAVRSNTENKIGFCRVENRVNVALSRARDGLFMFGNMECLINGSHNRSVFPETNLWDYINDVLSKKNMLGNSLPLVCPNHSDRFYSIEKPEDFDKYCPTGTCGIKCENRMKCGHGCKLLCHLDECEKHCEVMCKETLECGHEYNGVCKERYSYKCIVMCEVELPCGHNILVECYKRNDLSKIECSEPCNAFLHCKHICKGTCFKCKNGHILCSEICNKRLRCGHRCKKRCSERCTTDCKEPCNAILPCGHICKGTCSSCKIVHIPCSEPCERKLECGHQCKRLCREECECYEQLEKVLECGHTIKYKCCDKDKPYVFECKHPCGKILDCGHICSGTCSSCKYGHTLCKQPCDKILSCGHQCQNKCYERCTVICKVYVRLNGKSVACGHPQYIQCYNRNYPIHCNIKCSVRLPCGHKKSIICYMRNDLESIRCDELCNSILPCGHICEGECYECKKGHIPCREVCNVTLPCGHEKNIICYMRDNLESVRCYKPCKAILPCGHICGGTCSECKNGHIPCSEPCERIVKCQHQSESKCQNKCGEKCKSFCDEIIEVKLPCGHVSEIECCMKDDLESVECNEECNTLLPCGHTCEGTCSECKDGHIRCCEPCEKLLECGHIFRGRCYECENDNAKCGECLGSLRERLRRITIQNRLV